MLLALWVLSFLIDGAPILSDAMFGGMSGRTAGLSDYIYGVR